MDNFNENNSEKRMEETPIQRETLEEAQEEKVEYDEIPDFEEKPVSKWKTGWRKELLDWVQAIGIAIIVALVLKNFVLTLALVDGSSMEQTLSHGDRLYVNKLFYTPEKGDVVIIETDKHPQGPLVKRVIATEGDTIYIDPDTKEVYLNDKLLKEDYIKGETVLPAAVNVNGQIVAYRGNLAGVFASREYSRENPIVVGKGEIFAMGDNRENSSDSRDLGLFKVDEVLGHAVFRFWPLSEFGGLD